ncbi:MAG: TylF/MycF family methyltransferase, partial [Actinomycetota bacterium]|nr:TylF/MycF family methyltransferase [Actinomycetota bacterium]
MTVGKWDGERVAVTSSAPGADMVGDRYLDLLERCLTRYDLGDDFQPIVPGPRWMKRAWDVLSARLAVKNIVALRRVTGQQGLRREGRDWPVHAETMVGVFRLRSLR